MQLSFRTLSSFTSLLCFLLAIVWGFLPDMLLAIWSIESSGVAGFVARRSAVLFAALAIGVFVLAYVMADQRSDAPRPVQTLPGGLELPTPAETGNHLTPYLYGTDKE